MYIRTIFINDYDISQKDLWWKPKAKCRYITRITAPRTPSQEHALHESDNPHTKQTWKTYNKISTSTSPHQVQTSNPLKTCSLSHWPSHTRNTLLCDSTIRVIPSCLAAQSSPSKNQCFGHTADNNSPQTEVFSALLVLVTLVITSPSAVAGSLRGLWDEYCPDHEIYCTLVCTLETIYRHTLFPFPGPTKPWAVSFHNTTEHCAFTTFLTEEIMKFIAL